MHKDIETQRSDSQFQQQFINSEERNITDEANYIIERARNSDARVVSLGPLIFFSTDTRDAWMLDSQDNLALCLMQDGQEQPFVITETRRNFSIEWDSDYNIDGDVFVVTKKSGKARMIFGYPVKEVLRVADRIK